LFRWGLSGSGVDNFRFALSRPKQALIVSISSRTLASESESTSLVSRRS
jgi:hypothetical protein